MYGGMAFSGKVLLAGTSPDSGLGPKTILGQVVKSLYNSFNSMLIPFGLSIPRILVGAVALLAILVMWGIFNGMRNRKSFTLIDEEEEDGNLSESGDHLGSGVLRATAGTEGA